MATNDENENTNKDTGCLSNDSPAIVTDPFNQVDSWAKAGELLLEPGWLSRICNSFDPQGKLLRETSITEDLATKATLLCELLRARLRSPKYSRPLKPGKHKHWCLEWASENMTIAAAYMSLFGHAKKDISCVRESRSLLSKLSSNKYFSVFNAEGKLFGCYLAYDENNK